MYIFYEDELGQMTGAILVYEVPKDKCYGIEENLEKQTEQHANANSLLDRRRTSGFPHAAFVNIANRGQAAITISLSQLWYELSIDPQNIESFQYDD